MGSKMLCTKTITRLCLLKAPNRSIGVNPTKVFSYKNTLQNNVFKNSQFLRGLNFQRNCLCTCALKTGETGPSSSNNRYVKSGQKLTLNSKLLTINPTVTSIREFTSGSPSQNQQSFSADNGDRSKEYAPHDIGTNLRLHAENVYLSWMRNTYLMTIVSVTVINFAVSPTPAMIGAVAIVIAGMNNTIGSLGYMYNLSYMRRNGHMSRWVSLICQFGTLLHFLTWYIIATLLFPDLSTVDTELIEVEGTLTDSEDLKE